MSENKRRSFFFGLNKHHADSSSTAQSQQQIATQKKSVTSSTVMNRRISNAKNTNPFIKEAQTHQRNESVNSFKTFSVTHVDDPNLSYPTELPEQNILQSNSEPYRPEMNRSSSSSYTTHTLGNVTSADILSNAPELPTSQFGYTLDPKTTGRSRPKPPPVDMVHIRNISNRSDKTITSTYSPSSSVYTDVTNATPLVNDHAFPHTSQRTFSGNPFLETGKHRDFSKSSNISRQSPTSAWPNGHHKRERSQVEIYIDQLDDYIAEKSEKENLNDFDDNEKILSQEKHQDSDYGNNASHEVLEFDQLRDLSPTVDKVDSIPLQDSHFENELNQNFHDNQSNIQHEDYAANHSYLEETPHNYISDEMSPVKPLYNKRSSGHILSSADGQPYDSNSFLSSKFENMNSITSSRASLKKTDSFKSLSTKSSRRSSDEVSNGNTGHFTTSAHEYAHFNSKSDPTGPSTSDNRPLYPEPLTLTSSNSTDEYNDENEVYSFTTSVEKNKLPGKQQSVKEIQNITLLPRSSDSLSYNDEEQRLRVVNLDKPGFFFNNSDDDDEEEEDEEEVEEKDNENEDNGENEEEDTSYSFTTEDRDEKEYNSSFLDDFEKSIERHSPIRTYDQSSYSLGGRMYENDPESSGLLNSESALRTPMNFESPSQLDQSSYMNESMRANEFDSQADMQSQPSSKRSFKFPLSEGHNDSIETSSSFQTDNNAMQNNLQEQRKNEVIDQGNGNLNPGYTDTRKSLNLLSDENVIPSIPATPTYINAELSKDSTKFSPVSRSTTISTGVLRDNGSKVALVSGYVEELRYRYIPTANVLKPPPNLPTALKTKNSLELPQTSNIKVRIRTSSKQIGIKHGKAKQKLLSLEAPTEEDEYENNAELYERDHTKSVKENNSYVLTAEEEEEKMILSGIPGDDAYNSDDMMAPLREKKSEKKKNKSDISRSDSTKSYFTRNVNRLRSGTLDNSYIPPMGSFDVSQFPELPSEQSLPLYDTHSGEQYSHDNNDYPSSPDSSIDHGNIFARMPGPE